MGCVFPVMGEKSALYQDEITIICPLLCCQTYKDCNVLGGTGNGSTGGKRLGDML